MATNYAATYTTSAVDTTSIDYDRETREYVITDDGRVIGYAPNFHAAEQIRSAYLAQRGEG